jgi:hypothetical protein
MQRDALGLDMTYEATITTTPSSASNIAPVSEKICASTICYTPALHFFSGKARRAPPPPAVRALPHRARPVRRLLPLRHGARGSAGAGSTPPPVFTNPAGVRGRAWAEPFSSLNIYSPPRQLIYTGVGTRRLCARLETLAGRLCRCSYTNCREKPSTHSGE